MPATPVPLVGVEGVRARAGQELGVSAWHDVTQEQIDRFADLTGDHQWIHVDVERARSTPFGGTIAHGYFTLSLAPALCAEVYEVTDVSFGLNYGLDRVRFPAPMPVGRRVRLRVHSEAVEDVAGDGIQWSLTLTFEVEGGDKPACVARSLVRLYP